MEKHLRLIFTQTQEIGMERLQKEQTLFASISLKLLRRIYMVGSGNALMEELNVYTLMHCHRDMFLKEIVRKWKRQGYLEMMMMI